MIETILGGLIVATVTGLTFLAYKHPNGYSKIATVTNYFVSIGFAIYMIWILGYQQGFYAGNKLEKKLAHPELPIDPFPWLVIIVFVVLVYLSFLRILPKILETDKRRNIRERK